MRVAALASTQSRRLSWGARLVGAGLTATMAFGIAAGPASAHAVPRAVVACTSCKTTSTPSTPGCKTCQTKPPTGCKPCQTPPPPPCPTGATAIRVDDPETGPVAIPGDGTFQITVTESDKGEAFSFNVPSSAHRTVVRVTATGEDGGTTVKTYDSKSGYPDGIAAAGPIHAPAASDGKYEDLESIDFCVKPTPYV